MRLKKIAAPMLLCVLFGALLVQLPMAIAAKASDYEWIDPIITIRAMVLEYFVEDVDDDKLKDMQDSMINSMMASLDDPYSVYVPPKKKADFDKRLRGLYVGIGSEIDIIDGFLTIVTPMDDSPSLEQGILAGDTVLEIDGTSTFGMSIDDCIETLTGKPRYLCKATGKTYKWRRGNYSHRSQTDHRPNCKRHEPSRRKVEL